MVFAKVSFYLAGCAKNMQDLFAQAVLRKLKLIEVVKNAVDVWYLHYYI